MKVSYNWLKQLIDFTQSPKEISDILTQAGLEVESLVPIHLIDGKPLQGTWEGLVIGEVLTCEAHPNADRLRKTTVDIGNQVVPIVCGAPNVAQGQKVIVATVGATLHPTTGESFKIKKAKIRGEVSEGMICAEDEIGLGEAHEGIMVLTTDLPNGTPALDYFSVEHDHTIEIGLTPNRVDAASHLGVARDLKVLLKKDIQRPSVEDFKAQDSSEKITIKIENPTACPRYAGVVISGVKVAPSPTWLKNRLVAIGLTPINNLVDITNYVLHELGQPLHAFDADQIKGEQVIIKTLPEGTVFQTLDEVERKLSADDLMICNAEEGMCIAGVFGGLRSGISENTTRVFLESAYFSPDSIRKTSQRHGLKTDAAFRFERGADPDMALYALKRAALLMQEIAGGTIASAITDIYPQPIAPFSFRVTYRNIDRLIGKKLERSFIKETLEGLEITLQEETAEGFQVSVPPYRVDVQREVDIIEELLRLHGYNNIAFPATLSASYIANFPKVDPHILQNKVTDLLAAKGLSEIVTNSLTKPLYATQLKHLEEKDNVVILNKLSEELEVLRQSLIPSGLEVMLYNLNRQQKDLQLFEFGKVYRKVDQKYLEERKIGLFFSGNQAAESWLQAAQPVDFHYVAGIVQQVFDSLRLSPKTHQEASKEVFTYGLQYALGKDVVAQIGLLLSHITKMIGIKQAVFYAELNWETLLAHYQHELTYEDLPKYPEVRRDLSLILARTVSFEDIQRAAYQIAPKLLKDINVFSVYEGENIGEGKKSYAISFILQDERQTLTDKVIDKTMRKLIDRFRESFEAIIRE